MNKPLVFYCISVIVGILSFVFLKYNIILGAVVAASFFIIMFFTLSREFCILCLCFLCIGFISTYQYFSFNISKECNISIRIDDKNTYYSSGTYGGRKFNLEGKISTAETGDIVDISGNFHRNIDYENGIIGDIKITKIKCVKKDFISKMYDFRRKIYKEYSYELGEKNAGFVMSLCFGDTSYLNNSYKNDLKQLGIIHAVSVSGMHIGLIYEILERFFGVFVAVITSFIYVIFTGCLPATLRSFIMIFILKASYKLYKKYDALSALSLSALIMLVVKPYYITNIGFMLSYLATLGIILFYKKLKKVLYKLPKKLNEDLSLTLSAQFFAVPYAAMVLNNFSGGFVLGNLIIVPFYSAIVIMGNVGLILCNFKIIFSMLCSLINIILKSIDGLTSDLLLITPPIIYITSFMAITFTAILCCFIAIKKGYRQLIYLPIFFSVILFFQSYNINPNINYLKLNNKDALIINYRDKSVLITDKTIKDKNSMSSRLGINKYICTGNKAKIIYINKKYKILIENLDKDISIYYSGKNIFKINKDNIIYSKIYSKGYDIIRMPDYKKYAYAKVRATAFIILGKVLVLKGE